MSNDNEILTIAGKRVRVAHTNGKVGCFAGCCLWVECGRIRGFLCQGFSLTAYFVPAEESPNTIAEEDDARERQRNGLPAYSPVLNKASLDKKIDAFSEAHKGETAEQFEVACRGEEVPSDVQEDKAAMDYYLNLPNSSYGEGGNLLPRSINDAFKAGIAYERERLMNDAVEGEIVKDISGKLAVTAKVNLDGFKFGEKVSVIIIKKEK